MRRIDWAKKENSSKPGGSKLTPVYRTNKCTSDKHSDSFNTVTYGSKSSFVYPFFLSTSISFSLLLLNLPLNFFLTLSFKIWCSVSTTTETKLNMFSQISKLAIPALFFFSWVRFDLLNESPLTLKSKSSYLRNDGVCSCWYWQSNLPDKFGEALY